MTIEQDSEHSRETQRRLAGASRYNQRLIAMVAPYARGRLLDIGPGWGNITRAFLDREVVAIDIDPVYVEHINRTWASHGFSAQLCDAADPHLLTLFEAGSFDSAMSLNVIEHIVDDQAVLRHVVALLRPGGHFAVIVPAGMWLYGSMDRADGHHRRYDRRGIRRLFETAGLEVVRCRAFNAVGSLGWFFYGRVLRREYIPEGQTLSFADRLIAFGLSVERWLPMPFGQSILCVGRKPAG